MAKFSGASTAATGTITSSTASLIEFTTAMKHVIVSNDSGQKAYFVINDAATPAVSDTAYDFFLADGGAFVIEDALVENVGVYVAATSGIRVVGW